MALNAEHVRLARSLPDRLLRFFQRYPPSLYQGHQQAPGPGPNKNAISPSEALLRQSAAVESSTTSASSSPDDAAAATPSTDDRPLFNPFLPAKNFATGKWRSPVYSLRRQAELCKLARTHGVEDWLPYSKKLSWVRLERRIEQGSRVKGTGVGQRVKGHKWERLMGARLEKRRQAMLDMPRLIREWKERGHGRGWTKWPSGKKSK